MFSRKKQTLKTVKKQHIFKELGISNVDSLSFVN